MFHFFSFRTNPFHTGLYTVEISLRNFSGALFKVSEVFHKCNFPPTPELLNAMFSVFLNVTCNLQVCKLSVFITHLKERLNVRRQKWHKRVPFLLITAKNFPTVKTFKTGLPKKNEWAENFKKEKVNILVSSPIFHVSWSVKEWKEQSNTIWSLPSTLLIQMNKLFLRSCEKLI